MINIRAALGDMCEPGRCETDKLSDRIVGRQVNKQVIRKSGRNAGG